MVVMVMWFAWVIWGEFFSHENTQECHTQTHKSKFFPYKQVSGRNGDHEWLRMANTFICDLLWKVKTVMQWTEKAALIIQLNNVHRPLTNNLHVQYLEARVFNPLHSADLYINHVYADHNISEVMLFMKIDIHVHNCKSFVHKRLL